MPRNVAIVLDSDYADRLERLAFRTPVWVVDTPANRTAAEHAWHRAVEWPQIKVTLFRAPDSSPSREDWRTLLDQIDLHEHGFDAVEIIGSPMTVPARSALGELGFMRFDETTEGFRARERRT